VGQTEEQREEVMDVNGPHGMTDLPRCLFQHVAGDQYPTLVFIGGLHGNEPAGVQALQQVFGVNGQKLSGNVYALIGNRIALAENQRFVEIDLNRAWTAEDFAKAALNTSEELDEWSELADLKEQITAIIARHGHRKLVFFDLHTTSAESCPFLPFNDALMNRAVAEKFPVPLILGIEEHLQGSFMSYINDLDFPALAFEGGSHHDPASVERHAAFIRLSMHHFGVLRMSQEEINGLNTVLQPGHSINPGFYEILFRFAVEENSGFEMQPDYRNFQVISSGELLAQNHQGNVYALQSGRIFMPLYQNKGSDGFFIVRPVSAFWLRLSAVLRRLRIQRLVVYLPGVRRHPNRVRVYLANPRIARFLHREIFHLLGFRIKPLASGELMLIQRD